MSKDWTPQELALVDHFMMHFSHQKMEFELSLGGKSMGSVVTWDPDSEMAKQFPKLGFLFNPFERLWKKAKTNPHFRNKLLAAEKQLAELICRDISSISEHKVPDLSNISETIVSWYLGKLDSGFYYNERNNELFMEWLDAECNRWMPTRYNDAAGEHICIGDIVHVEEYPGKYVGGALDFEGVVEERDGKFYAVYHDIGEEQAIPLSMFPVAGRRILNEAERKEYWRVALLGEDPPEYLYKRGVSQLS